uniref:Vigilin n=1 Tax=Diabrotica virgifera virgifera TaxID=50390 RepID=A0A6P7F816_DIAVI
MSKRKPLNEKQLIELIETGLSDIDGLSYDDNDDYGWRDGEEEDSNDISLLTIILYANRQISIPKEHHRWILGKKGDRLKELEKTTATKISVPAMNDPSDILTITGTKEGIEKAEHEIRVTSDQQSKKASERLNIPRHFHPFITGPFNQNLNNMMTVSCIMHNIPFYFSGTITLRGPHDKLGLALSVVYEKANSVRSSDVDAPSWIHKYIIGRKGANIKEITQNLPKVHVEFTGKDDKIKIEGPPEEVEKAQEQLESIAKDLISKMTFLEMHVDPRLFKHIIGKSGANINKLKEDFNVLINIDESGLVRIEGNRDDVASTRTELEQRIFKLENEKEKDVIIEQRHYRNIIGTKGENIKDIRDRFNQVQIYFPGPGDRNDIVKVRGPKEDVDKCARHLEKLVKELNESWYKIDLPIYKQFHKFIIGKGGANIRKIREETQTKIDLPDEGDKNDTITITGKKENVEEACEKIRKIQDELENIVTEEITIPPKFYNSLIGAKGKLIHSIMEDCGGVTIKFPTADSKSDKVTIRGPKEDVERAKQQLLDLANERQLASFSAEVSSLFYITTVESAYFNSLNRNRLCYNRKYSYNRDILITAHWGSNIYSLNRNISIIGILISGVNCTTSVNKELKVHIIKIDLTGKETNCQQAKQALLDLVPITIAVDVPFDFHRSIIGQKGRDVKDLMDRYDVHIVLSAQDIREDIIKITGTANNVEDAKQALLDRVKDLEADRKDRELRSFGLQVEVPPEYHPKIIGKKGAVITKIRKDHDVQITFPKKGDPEESIIIITGYETNANNAKDDIMKIVNELNELVKEEISIDSNVHSRLIGARGRNIRKIMEDFNVDIKFPRDGDADENLVIITGQEESVLEAKDHLLNLAEEYLQDYTELQTRERLHTLSSHFEPPAAQNHNAHRNRDEPNNGFVVQGGPWEQQRAAAPNTASVTEFPSFRRNTEEPQSSPAPVAGAWGSRR